MKIKIALSLVLAFITLTGKAQTSQQKQLLGIGDQAPQLEVHKWLKGTPVKGFEKGKVYVVECWATWCGPCIMAMPHLSELAQKYRNKVTIIGVSVWESNSKPVPDAVALQSFVDKKGKDMDYTVAMDNPATNKFADAWLKAAGLKGIPATFVIDRNGTIAWMGHPLDVDSILHQIVEKPETYDINRAKAEYNKGLVLQAKQENVKKIMGAGMMKNHGIAIQETRRLIKEDPSFEVENFWTVLWAFLNNNGKTALTYIEEKLNDANFLKKLNGGKGMTKEEVLDMFAKEVVQHTGLDIYMYYNAVEHLNKIVQKTPNDLTVWPMLAQGYINLNEPDKAIPAQEKAIALFQDDIKSKPKENYQTAALKRMMSKLEEYKKLKEKKEVFFK